MASLPLNLAWEKAQTIWSALLNPVIANPLNGVEILNNIVLINGSTIINHKLGRKLQGWWIISPSAASTIYQPPTTMGSATTLTLVSTAAMTVDIAVF